MPKEQSQSKEQYQEYLKSSHWKSLRANKIKDYCSRKGRAKCSLCGSDKSLQVHHLYYGNLYDVRKHYLRLMCERCHSAFHSASNFDPLKKKYHRLSKKSDIRGCNQKFKLMRAIVHRKIKTDELNAKIDSLHAELDQELADIIERSR